jgi:hypothetical protein
MAFRIVMARVVAAQRDTLNDVWDALFSSGADMFSIPLRPAGSQGPATHYGFNMAGTKPAQADAISAFTDGVMPEFVWADGAPTQNAPAWGQGSLPSEAAVQAMIANQNLRTSNMAGGGAPAAEWPGFIGGLNLEIVDDEEE